MKKSFARLVALALLCGFVAGCNTVEGIGKDVKKAGSTIEEAAKKK